jgi:hypothetical protein
MFSWNRSSVQKGLDHDDAKIHGRKAFKAPMNFPIGAAPTM